jgi:hypothetical protein
MNLSVKARLLTAFTTILLLLLAIAFLLTRKLSETNDRLTDIVNLSAKKVSLSQQILVNVINAGRHEKNLILEKDPSEMKRFRDDMTTSLAKIDKKTSELAEITDEQGKKILDEFINSWNAYKTKLDTIVAFALKNEDEKAFEISIRSGYQVREKALATLNVLVEKNEAGMAADKLRSDESYKAAINLIVFLIVISLIISTGLVYWIIQGIGKRI